ncbi:hypothetical protein [Pseudomonas aeruginosa]|uniref:hypothetical protein n=1 Tax=Pseudomonas aeruginosa TaxID=287 RepID=UPI00104925F4|nr:hypothetical protein [Pseudomonas aeruginosa]
MKLRLITTAFLISALTACDSGTITSNKECGISTDNPNRVESENTEICNKDKSSIVENTLFSTLHESVTPENHSAANISAEIEEDLNLKTTKEESSKIIAISSEGINFLLFFLIIVSILLGLFRLLISKSTNERLDYDVNRPKYNTKVVITCMVAACFFCLLRYDYYNIATRLAAVAYFTQSKMLFNNVSSSYIASIQTGDMITSTDKKEVVKDSAAAFKAKVITEVVTKGTLQDLRTAKYQFHKDGERKIEHNEPLNERILEDSIKFYRTYDNNILNDVVRIDITTKPLKNSYFNKIYEDALQKNITADISNLESSTSKFKKQIEEAGFSKESTEINAATQLFITEVFTQFLHNKVKENLPKHYSLSRLIESTNCYDLNKKISKSIAYESSIFIKYLQGKGEALGRNDCISEEKKGEFKILGQEELVKVENSIEELTNELFNDYYQSFSEFEAALAKVTVDKDNSYYCKKARQDGQITSIAYLRKCAYANALNRELMNTIAKSFTIKDSFRGSFIQTEYTKDDLSRAPMLNDNFDKQFEKISTYIDVDTKNSAYANDEEYLNYLVSSNEEFDQGDITKLFFEPTKLLQRSLGIKEEKCEGILFACVDIDRVPFIVNDYADNIMKYGIIPLSASIAASVVVNNKEKANDKSDLGDIEFKAKGTAKNNANKQKSNSSFISAVLSSMTKVSVAAILFATYAKLVINFPEFFFTMTAIGIFVYSIYSVLLFGFKFVWAAFAADENNIKSNARKIFGSLIIGITLPTIMFIFYVVISKLYVVVILSTFSTVFALGDSVISLIAASIIAIPILHIVITMALKNLYLNPVIYITKIITNDSVIIESILGSQMKLINILSFGFVFGILQSINPKESNK